MKQVILNLEQDTGTLEHQSNTNDSVESKIMYSTSVLKSNLWDDNNAYILVKGDITIIGHSLAIEVAFKNCVLFIKCITKMTELQLIMLKI